jgi:very-short-patch-repair endonuclease
MERYGIKVIRFMNEKVLGKGDRMLTTINRMIQRNI